MRSASLRACFQLFGVLRCTLSLTCSESLSASDDQRALDLRSFAYYQPPDTPRISRLEHRLTGAESRLALSQFSCRIARAHPGVDLNPLPLFFPGHSGGTRASVFWSHALDGWPTLINIIQYYFVALFVSSSCTRVCSQAATAYCTIIACPKAHAGLEQRYFARNISVLLIFVPVRIQSAGDRR